MHRPLRRWPTLSITSVAAALLAASSVFLAACGGGADKAAPAGASNATGGSGAAPAAAKNVTLRLGFFPNLTHAQPQVGLARGTFAEEFGANVKIETKTFNAGPAAIEALFAGAIDATYIGPNPTIAGYVQSQGKDVRIVAGATSAGALLVVRGSAGIEKPADFANKKIATPQLGGTQDVALRAWLQKNGLKDKEHGGNVQVIPTNNADALSLIARGQLDGAWVPEPWATRILQEAGGKVFLDERDLWPNGDFVTTHLIVRTKFLQENPDVVERLVRAHVKTTLWINDNPDEAKKLTNESIKKITSAGLSEQVINAAWRNQKITNDPIASSLRQSANDAFALGFLGDKKPDLSGLYALETLNKVLKELNLKPIQQ